MRMGRQIKGLLFNREIKQVELASAINLDAPRLSLYLRDYLNLPEKYVKKICKYLDLDFNEYKKGELKERTKK